MNTQELLKKYLNSQRDHAFQELAYYFTETMRGSYFSHYYQTEEGKERLRVYTDLILNNIWLPADQIIEDHTRVGYKYAVDGLKVDELNSLMVFVQNLIHRILCAAQVAIGLSDHEMIEYQKKFQDNFTKAIGALFMSFIKARDELIGSKISKLESLYSFTQQIVNFTETGKIMEKFFLVVDSFYKADALHFVVFDNFHISTTYSYPINSDLQKMLPIIDIAIAGNHDVFVNKVNALSNVRKSSECYYYVFMPICIDRYGKGVSCLDMHTNGIYLDEYDMIYLHQLLKIAAMTIADVLTLRELKTKNREVTQLMTELIDVREEERKNVAADIHDSLAQDLAVVSYKLDVMKFHSGKDVTQFNDGLEALITFVHETIGRTRKIIRNLRPDVIDELGFASAMRQFCNDYSNETGINLIIDMPNQLNISNRISIHLYRVVQEALKNIQKYSGARVANISVGVDNGYITMRIFDEGNGFDLSLMKNKPVKNRFGLLMMKERIELLKGTLSINSNVGAGCQIEARVPLA